MLDLTSYANLHLLIEVGEKMKALFILLGLFICINISSCMRRTQPSGTKAVDNYLIAKTIKGIKICVIDYSDAIDKTSTKYKQLLKNIEEALKSPRTAGLDFYTICIEDGSKGFSPNVGSHGIIGVLYKSHTVEQLITYFEAQKSIISSKPDYSHIITTRRDIDSSKDRLVLKNIAAKIAGGKGIDGLSDYQKYLQAYNNLEAAIRSIDQVNFTQAIIHDGSKSYGSAPPSNGSVFIHFESTKEQIIKQLTTAPTTTEP